MSAININSNSNKTNINENKYAKEYLTILNFTVLQFIRYFTTTKYIITNLLSKKKLNDQMILLIILNFSND